MTESLDERLAALVGTTDTFRLTIRAHALIDEKLDELLSYAFVAERPSFLRGPSFRRRSTLRGAWLDVESTEVAELAVLLFKADLRFGRRSGFWPTSEK